MSTHEIETRINTIRDEILEEEGHLMDAELKQQEQVIAATRRELQILRYQLQVLIKRHGVRLAPFCLLIVLLAGCTPY